MRHSLAEGDRKVHVGVCKVGLEVDRAGKVVEGTGVLRSVQVHLRYIPGFGRSRQGRVCQPCIGSGNERAVPQRRHRRLRLLTCVQVQLGYRQVEG